MSDEETNKHNTTLDAKEINGRLFSKLISSIGLDDVNINKSPNDCYAKNKNKNRIISWLFSFPASASYEAGIYNYRITEKVLERLMLRHSVLHELELLEGSYEASKTFDQKKKNIAFAGLVGKSEEIDNELKKRDGSVYESNNGTENNSDIDKNDNKAAKEQKNSKANIFDCTQLYHEYEYNTISERNLRSYRLATTDLFVEKAIVYLEEDYNKYIVNGIRLFTFAFVIMLIGIIASWYSFFILPTNDKSGGLQFLIALLHGNQIITSDFVSAFAKGFTFYGFLVLLAVACSGLGKAMMDQAERLRERRHSLRQGRLYIHLSNGEVTIEEIEKAFDWNVSKGNAFANIKVEASAPWGGVIKEALKAIPEIVKRSKT